LPEFWKGLGALRVGAMAGIAAALTGFFLYVFGMIAEAPMAILYSGLEPREAGAVAAKLDGTMYDWVNHACWFLVVGAQCGDGVTDLGAEFEYQVPVDPALRAGPTGGWPS